MNHISIQYKQNRNYSSSYLFPGVSCLWLGQGRHDSPHENLSARFNISLLNGRRNLYPLQHSKNRFQLVSERPWSVRGSNLLDLTPRITPSIILIQIFPEIRQKPLSGTNYQVRVVIIKSAYDYLMWSLMNIYVKFMAGIRVISKRINLVVVEVCA